MSISSISHNKKQALQNPPYSTDFYSIINYDFDSFQEDEERYSNQPHHRSQSNQEHKKNRIISKTYYPEQRRFENQYENDQDDEYQDYDETYPEDRYYSYHNSYKTHHHLPKNHRSPKPHHSKSAKKYSSHHFHSHHNYNEKYDNAEYSNEVNSDHFSKTPTNTDYYYYNSLTYDGSRYKNKATNIKNQTYKNANKNEPNFINFEDSHQYNIIRVYDDDESTQKKDDESEKLPSKHSFDDIEVPEVIITPGKINLNYDSVDKENSNNENTEKHEYSYSEERNPYNEYGDSLKTDDSVTDSVSSYSHKHCHSKSPQLRSTNENAKGIPKNKSNIIRRKPLELSYKKFMNQGGSKTVFNKSQNNAELNSRKEILNEANESYSKFNNSEDSIFDFSDNSLCVNKFCGQNSLTSQIEISTSKVMLSSSSKQSNFLNRKANENIRFIGSEDISSGKVNDILCSSSGSNDEHEDKNENDEMPEQALSDKINLKITVKDPKNLSQKKTHKFCFNSKNCENESVEIEEEEEDLEEEIPQSPKFKFEDEKPIVKRSPNKSDTNSKVEVVDDKVDCKISKESPNKSNTKGKKKIVKKKKMTKEDFSLNRKFKHRIKKTEVAKKQIMPEPEEEEVSDGSDGNDDNNGSFGSFCDVSTSCDCQDQFISSCIETNSSDYDNISESNESEKKKYKTVEINVSFKEIKEATGKLKKSPSEKSYSSIARTHRRKKKVRDIKKLVDRSIQTDEVDRPELTIAMLSSY